MGTQQLSLDNFTTDPAVYQEILSHTGMCPNPSVTLTCKALKAVTDRIIVLTAEYFVNNVNRALWNPPGFPDTAAGLTLEKGREILSAAAEKVRTLRESFFNLKTETDPFPDKSSATIAVMPELFCTFLDTADFAELLRILKHKLPDTIQTATRSEQIKAISAISWLLLGANLHDNRLQALPESFGSLIALTHLSLDRNQLQALPESLGNLGNLKRLDIRCNSLALARHAPSIAILLKLRQQGCLIECDEEVKRAIQEASQATEESPAGKK